MHLVISQHQMPIKCQFASSCYEAPRLNSKAKRIVYHLYFLLYLIRFVHSVFGFFGRFGWMKGLAAAFRRLSPGGPGVRCIGFPGLLVKDCCCSCSGGVNFFSSFLQDRLSFSDALSVPVLRGKILHLDIFAELPFKICLLFDSQMWWFVFDLFLDRCRGVHG